MWLFAPPKISHIVLITYSSWLYYYTDKCALARDSGDECEDDTAASNKWFYDRREGSCQQFVYKGCYGNDNKFDTKEECTTVCSITS